MLVIPGTETRSDIDHVLDDCAQLIAERAEIERILTKLGPAWNDAGRAPNECTDSWNEVTPG